MANLNTSFMGLQLSSPVIVGACTLSNRVDNVKKAEAAGAGALVVYSLFQEQIEQEARELEDELMIGSEQFAESLTYFPHMESAGPREHIMWIEKTRAEVKFPLIGSLNATSMGNWVQYAKQLESAGCDALELNLYSVQTDPIKTAEDIEKRALEVVAGVKSVVDVPVAVKLSPWYTSMASFASKVVDAGADGLVLFNRFYQPTIDPAKEALVMSLDLSRPEDLRLPLRWIAILSGQMEVDLAASTGVHSGKDVVRQLLAGAMVAQTVSALYENGIDHVSTMNREISDWMDAKGYKSMDEFRGKLNSRNIADPYAFERAQYIRLLLEKAEEAAPVRHSHSI